MKFLQTLEIHIVGSGFGMLSLLDRLLQENLSDSVIRIFSKDHGSIGEAYKSTPDIFLLNTKASAFNFFDHIKVFSEWLKEQSTGVDNPGEYLPRAIVGSYLADIKHRLMQSHRDHNNLILFCGSVYFINSNSQIVSDQGVQPRSDVTFLSIGFGSIFHIKKVIQQIEMVPQNGEMTIFGSGLSGIDLILLTAELRPDLKISCVSPSGSFPRIRTNFPVQSGCSILRSPKVLNNPTIKSVFEELSAISTHPFDRAMLLGKHVGIADECAFAEVNVSGWQSALYNATLDYSQFFSHLSAEEQNMLFKHRRAFIKNRVMFPVCNAKRLISLINNGRLKISKGQENCIQECNRSYIYAINSNSQLENFIYLSRLPRHIYGGVVCSLSGRINDSRNIYALGPITNGIRYFTEASAVTMRDAKLAVSNALLHLDKCQFSVANFMTYGLQNLHA